MYNIFICIFRDCQINKGGQITCIPLADGINSWTLGGVAVFLLSGQLSGSPCQPQVLVIRDFATTCTCTCQHYYAIFMHVYMYTCMHTYTYALCGYTRHLRTCRYAAIHVNRPSGISQAAAIAANRTQGVNEGGQINEDGG